MTFVAIGALRVTEVRTEDFFMWSAKADQTELIPSLIWLRGYKTFFMLNSTEHELSTAHKN